MSTSIEDYDKIRSDAETFARMTANTLNEGGTVKQARAYAKQYAEAKARCEAILAEWKAEAGDA